MLLFSVALLDRVDKKDDVSGHRKLDGRENASCVMRSIALLIKRILKMLDNALIDAASGPLC
jgi:hypothetical protein